MTSTTRGWGVALAAGLLLWGSPLLAQPESWTTPFPAHRIVGNLYSVGTWDLSVFLVTSEEGHVLINTGLESSTPLIRENVESLGFRLEDVSILLTMQAHADHTAALAEIKELTGAQMWATEGDARVLADGGFSDPQFGGAVLFPPVSVDRILRDGERIELGDIRLTVHEHPGHTEGSSSYTMAVSENGRDYRVGIVNMGTINPGKRLFVDPTYPGVGEDFAETYRRQKAMQVDVWVAAHASQYGLHEKWKPGDPYSPDTFVDPDGLRAEVERLEAIYLAAAAEERAVAGSPRESASGVAVLLVDTDRATRPIDERLYGHFLEHINHSVVDGLYAEQVRGQGFEAGDFATYWEAFGEGGGDVEIAEVRFEKGRRSARLLPGGGTAGIRQARFHIESGHGYDGSLWARVERGAPRLTLRVVASKGDAVATIPLEPRGSEWQELSYAFSSPVDDAQASLELAASGQGALLVDHVSLMRADARANGMLRPDLVEALRGLAPPFLRWPGGSFASIYAWKDGIGPQVSRRYHPNSIWGDYSDYYGFGTDEFMELARQLGAEPLIVLKATSTDAGEVQDAMDWVRYLNDPQTTEWGARRAAGGHPEPYGVRYFQIDNEPMNHGLTPEQYAEIVNVYGSRLREIAPRARIVACGQKRSNDLAWSRKLIDLAGENFDILGVHNYEYETENYEAGVRRIRDYLVKLRDYLRASAHPDIEIGVLEWNLSRSYDWRAGLHAAGSLILYEELGPEVTMSCPALLMRNTSDDPTWTAFIYHDHESWFPGSGYVVEKLFREHYAERYLASTSGTFRDLPDRDVFFDEISTMKPEDWMPGTVDAIATSSADGRRLVIKAVNYAGYPNTLLVRLQGSGAPDAAEVRIYTLSAGLEDAASLEHPDAIAPVERSLDYARDMALDLEPHAVVVVEIEAR